MKFEFSLCEIHLIFMEETFLKTQLKQEFVYNKILSKGEIHNF